MSPAAPLRPPPGANHLRCRPPQKLMFGMLRMMYVYRYKRLRM